MTLEAARKSWRHAVAEKKRAERLRLVTVCSRCARDMLVTHYERVSVLQCPERHITRFVPRHGE